MGDKWVDVFVTRADEDSSNSEKYAFDDVFCCPVQSVYIDPKNAEHAYITTEETEWVCPLWSIEYGVEAAKGSHYNDIQKGDVIRIGRIENGGFTDYLTVVDVKTVESIRNGTVGKVRIGHTDGTSHELDIGGKEDLNGFGIAHKCLRLNTSLNCTKLEGVMDNSVDDTQFDRDLQIAAQAEGKSSTCATLETRHNAYPYIANPAPAYPGDTLGSEKFYYPLYLTRHWGGIVKPLRAKFDHSIKKVHAIKLIGYSLLNKRQVGIQHAHEMIADDYVVIRIAEVNGEVVSNNSTAHGSFAILQCGHTSDMSVGATEFSRYEPAGIASITLPSSMQTLNSLTIEVLDRSGAPANFGRFHLWFKLLATHG